LLACVSFFMTVLSQVFPAMQNLSLHLFLHLLLPPNGLRYLRWGGDGEAVQPEKC